MTSNEDRISQLEENNRALKKVILDLNRRVSVLEARNQNQEEDPPEPISNEWTVTYRDDVSTTLYNEHDDLGCVIKASVYNDSLMDLELGETYTDLLIPSNIQMDKPVKMRSFVYTIKPSGCIHLKWKNRRGNLFAQGIINKEDVNQEIKEIVERKNVEINKHGGFDLMETMTLKVLPYFVKKAGWRLKTH